MIDIFEQIEAYKQQNPDFEETMRVLHEIMPIYRETMQIMRDIDLALHPYTITTNLHTRRHTGIESEIKHGSLHWHISSTMSLCKA